MSFTLIQLCNFLHIKLIKNSSFFKINLVDETEKFVFIKSKSQSTSASTDNPKNCLIMELESFNGILRNQTLSLYISHYHFAILHVYHFHLIQIETEKSMEI